MTKLCTNGYLKFKKVIMAQLVRSSIHDFFPKLFWACAPLLLGLSNWFFIFGPGAPLRFPFSLRLLISILFLSWYFSKTLDKASVTNQVTFFEYRLPMIHWRLLIIPAIILLLFYWVYSVFGSPPELLRAIIISVLGGCCLEELLSRAFFIKYRMSGMQFMIFNFISATSFTIMHMWGSRPFPSVEMLFGRGHFIFGAFLGILAYNSQRIEIPILVHMASNFFRYVVPTLILKTTPSMIYIYGIQIIEYILLAGIAYTTYKKNALNDERNERIVSNGQ
jgi:membrane protease YdiL (CAAX protease family)